MNHNVKKSAIGANFTNPRISLPATMEVSRRGGDIVAQASQIGEFQVKLVVEVAVN